MGGSGRTIWNDRVLTNFALTETKMQSYNPDHLAQTLISNFAAGDQEGGGEEGAGPRHKHAAAGARVYPGLAQQQAVGQTCNDRPHF